MRILTVRQPWAWAIIHGSKDVENRSRNIAGDYRGPVAIHAGLTVYEQQDWLISNAVGKIARSGGTVGLRNVPSRFDEPDEARFHVTERYGYRGCIIGVVDLVDVHHSTTCPIYVEDAPWPLCSRWSQRDSWHLKLTNPRLLPEPIPYRGALGLRELPAEVEQQIWQQIGGQR